MVDNAQSPDDEDSNGFSRTPPPIDMQLSHWIWEWFFRREYSSPVAPMTKPRDALARCRLGPSRASARPFFWLSSVWFAGLSSWENRHGGQTEPRNRAKLMYKERYYLSYYGSIFWIFWTSNWACIHSNLPIKMHTISIQIGMNPFSWKR
jgi:hypothetical protein